MRQFTHPTKLRAKKVTITQSNKTFLPNVSIFPRGTVCSDLKNQNIENLKNKKHLIENRVFRKLYIFYISSFYKLYEFKIRLSSFE